MFDGRKAVLFDDRWASAREDLAKLWLIDESEIDADWPRLSERFEGAGQRRRHAGQLVAGQGPGRGSQRPRLAVRPCRGRRGEPGQGSLQRRDRGGHRCVEGIDRRVGGRPAARRRCDRHRDDVQARRRPAGVLPQPVPRQRPLRRGAVGGARQHGVLLRHRRAGCVGRQRADRKPWAAVDSPQGRADADAAVPVRGAAGGRRPVRGRVALRDGDEGAAVGRAAADRRAVAHRRRARHRVAAARGAARFAEPRHVRRRRRLRRVQVRARRGGVAVEGRVVVGAAGSAWRTR